ncbi:restriction endonuclease [Streptomyces caniferus]|uniref:restriction endonuclease n=1 Tax=Streptomyces caniferus TaxID=285557 RepID=UPI002E2A5444|nr:restriction endonuclease [Streptomyces caniferus]
MTSTSDPLWQRYELSVREMLKALDPDAEVTHNKHVTGRLSNAPRQLDVWVTGKVVGLEVTVAVECKRHGRPASIEVVDQFIGKVLDIGADRGVLYSYSGFSSNAVSRALGSSNPSIMVIALDTPEIVKTMRAPGFPVDLLAQDEAPQWVDEMDEGAFQRFLGDGQWSKFWS